MGFGFFFPALAASGPEDLPLLGTGECLEARGGETVVLRGGQVVRLAEIIGPETQGAARTQAALGALVVGQTLRLYGESPRADRYGRLHAHGVTADGRWVQGALVEAGLARVVVRDGESALSGALLALEERARRAGRGLWPPASAASPPPGALAATEDGFQVVEGRIVSAARAGRRIYLNFGADWRSDFTVSLSEAMLGRLLAMGRDPLAWAGRPVRVRGWVTRRNGPLLDLPHPMALEGPLDEGRFLSSKENLDPEYPGN
nr:thermonuclease family protein [Rhodospirillum rubrum]